LRPACGGIRGEVLFDAFSRGRYATDASNYQIEPVGTNRSNTGRSHGEPAAILLTELAGDDLRRLKAWSS
jgi:hypothetical protein